MPRRGLGLHTGRLPVVAGSPFMARRHRGDTGRRASLAAATLLIPDRRRPAASGLHDTTIRPTSRVRVSSSDRVARKKARTRLLERLIGMSAWGKEPGACPRPRAVVCTGTAVVPAGRPVRARRDLPSRRSMVTRSGGFSASMARVTGQRSNLCCLVRPNAELVLREDDGAPSSVSEPDGGGRRRHLGSRPGR